MGESWSDLDAMEYQFENGYSTGAGPYVIGAYATGNPTVGIRDYALDHNPLNYSDLGFDIPRRRSACGRRDLERHELLGPASADRQVQRDLSGGRRIASARVRTRQVRGRCVPGQPALDPDHVRRLAPDALDGEHARREGRVSRRGHDAVRRRESDGALARVRVTRHGKRRVERHERGRPG